MGQLDQALSPFSNENVQQPELSATTEGDLDPDSKWHDAEEARHPASSACSEDESFQDAMSEGLVPTAP